jgi:glutamine---fructose-6-phosphate transaminase (isomerizing)
MKMSDEQAMMPIAATREEVANQPQFVSHLLDRCAQQVRQLAHTLAARNTEQIFASGSGDSWFAAQAVAMAWELYSGLPFRAHQAYEYAAYGTVDENSKTAHFVISSSGRPTTTWDALDRALDTEAYVIGITDNDAAENPFISRATASLIPGAVKVGWPTQTTTATIALLLDLAIATGEARGNLSGSDAARLQGELRAVAQNMEGVLDASRGWAQRLGQELAEQRLFTLVGGGPSYAVCQIGSALLAEGPQEIGVVLTVEEFHHALRIAAIRRQEPVILVAPDGKCASRCRDTARVVRQWGARLIPLVTGELEDLLDDSGDGLRLPSISEPFSPLLTVLPLQMLSLALASQKVSGGYERPRTVPQ